MTNVSSKETNMADEEISPEEESREELINEPITLDSSAPKLVKSETGNNTGGNMSENETEFVEASEVQITESQPVEGSVPTTEQLQEISEPIEIEPEKANSVGVQPVEPTKVSQKSRLSAKFHRKEQPRHTERQFLEMIGKREVRNEELGKKEGALRHRLDVLECSMPAVMVWNIWRMAQGAPVTGLRRIVERQFRHATEGPACPRTPSRHYDCRVREVEAERKLAQKRVDEARTLCAEKTAHLEEKQKKLDEAKRTQEERKRKLEELTKELKNLKDNLNQMDASSGDCVAGECGDIECCERWMKKVTSNTSIKSIDIDYLERIQELAEAELCMKKQIADLEYREDTYMRTLQEADDCWSKLDSDSAQSQLERKEEICRQLAERVCDLEDQLERMTSKFSTSIVELEKYVSVEKIEALIGRDDDMASTYDKATSIQAKLSGKIVGRESDLAWTTDAASMARILQKDRAVDKQADLIGVSDREIGVSPADLEYEAQEQAELERYFSMLGSLDELDKDDDYVCPPEFVCNDVVTSPTGMEAEELERMERELEEKASRRLIDKGKVAEDIQLGKEYVDFDDAEYDDEYVCEPDFICNDVVTSPTGMDDDELRKYEEATAAAVVEKIEVGVGEKVEEIVKEESVVRAEEEIRETAERESAEAAFVLEEESEIKAEEEEAAPLVEEEEVTEMEKAVTIFEEGEISAAAISEKGVGPELEEAEPLVEDVPEMTAEEIAVVESAISLAIPPIPEEKMAKMSEEEELPAEVQAEKPAEVEEIEVEPKEVVEVEEAKETVEIEEAKEVEEAIDAPPEVGGEPAEKPEAPEEESAAVLIDEKLPPEPVEEEVKAIPVVEEEEGLVAEIEEGEVEAVAEIEEGEVEVVAEIKEEEEELVAEIEEGEVEAVAEVEEEEVEVAVEMEKEEEELAAEVTVEGEKLEAELEEGEIPVESEAEIVGEEKMPLELIEEEEEPLEEEILEEELPPIEEREITEEDLLPEVPLPEAEEEEEEIPAEEIPSEEEIEEEIEEIIEEEIEEIIEEVEEVEVAEEEEKEIEVVKEIPLEGEIPVEIVEKEEVPEEVEPIIEKPEIEILDIEPIEEKVKPKPFVPFKKPIMLIDPQIVSKPYLSVAEVEQTDKASVKPMIQKYLAFVNRFCAMQPSVSEEIKIIKSEITKTETVQTELVQSKVCQKLTQTLIATNSQTFSAITIPAKKVQDTPVSKLYEKSRGTSLTSPKRVQCQFQKWPTKETGISTADKSSQTDRSFSKDRDTRYFSSAGESSKTVKCSKGDLERELRSISYKKSEEPQGDCVCSACGKPNQGQKRLVAPLPALIHPIPLQPMKKPKVPFLKDPESCKLCPDCRCRKKKLSDEPKARRRSPKSPLACDSTACICASSASRTKILSVFFKNFDKPQRKDQGCTAKIPKLKTLKYTYV